MIDPKRVIPLLTNMSVDREIGRGPNGTVYQVTRRLDGKKLALKHISIPANDAQTKALIFAGAVSSEAEAQKYYSTLVQEIKSEILTLNGIESGSNLLKFRGYQVDQKIIGIGFDVYLLEDFCRSLPEYLMKNTLTRLQAVNLGIDLCSALEQLRSAGLVHKDIRPNNVFFSDSHFLLGDLGVVQSGELSYTSMPDQLITEYTAPEVIPEDASLSANMDIYSVGMILYEIYNGYAFPDHEGGAFERTAEELPAPAYADLALSEIILKACAYDPDDRYQDPSEMKQALILYLQRGNVTDDPLVPPPPPAEDDASVDVSAIAAAVEAGQSAESEKEAGEEVSAVDPDETKIVEPVPQDEVDPAVPEAEPESIADAEPAAEPLPDEATRLFPSVDNSSEEAASSETQPEDAASETPETEEAPEETIKFSLNDISDDDLLVPTSGEISVEDFLASIRTAPGLEVLSMDSSGNTVTVPGYETEESLPEDTQFVDSADSRVVPDYEAEAAVPEETDFSVELPLSESASESPIPDEIEEPEPEPEEAPAPAPVSRGIFRKRRQPEPEDEDDEDDEDDESYDDEDDDYDDYDDDDYDDTSSAWKKALIAVIVLLVLAGGAFAGYTFKTDTVSNMRTEVLSSSSVQVKADRKNGSAMEVVCSTAAGEVAREAIGAGGATFTGLNPSTTYTFTMKSTDGKLLLGSKSVEAKTAQMTNLTGFAASSLSAVSADLVISGTGDQPESWVITCTGDNGDSVNVTARDASQAIHVDGLTPDTHYTATSARGDGDQLGGTTSCEFTTQGYTELSSFDSTTITVNSATVQWSYSGTVPNTWTVTCEGTDNSSTTQEISGTECTLDGLEPGVTYTITLNCPSLKPTELNTINVNIPTVTISEITSELNDDGEIEVKWEYTSDITPKEWSISYNYRSENPVTATLVTSDTNSVTLKNLVPEAEYTITVQTADDLQVGGTAETICVTDEAPDFTEYEASGAELTLYALEDNQDGLENETDSFTTDQHLAFAVQVDYEATDEDKTVRTLYIVRNADGTPVYVYRNDDPGRTWSGSWTTARHTGDLPDMPQKPGSYTLEIYFDGGLLASGDFTVEAE